MYKVFSPQPETSPSPYYISADLKDPRSDSRGISNGEGEMFILRVEERHNYSTLPRYAHERGREVYSQAWKASRCLDARKSERMHIRNSKVRPHDCSIPFHMA